MRKVRGCYWCKRPLDPKVKDGTDPHCTNQGCDVCLSCANARKFPKLPPLSPMT